MLWPKHSKNSSYSHNLNNNLNNNNPIQSNKMGGKCNKECCVISFVTLAFIALIAFLPTSYVPRRSNNAIVIDSSTNVTFISGTNETTAKVDTSTVVVDTSRTSRRYNAVRNSTVEVTGVAKVETSEGRKLSRKRV